jgi:nucleotide-binding universal stress UspA family protein
MKNIIIAVDFSEHTETIINSIKTIAKATSSQVWLLHIAAPEPDFLGYETGPQTERNHIAFRFREEHRQLQELAEKLRQNYIQTTALLLQGATIETIISEAEKLKADLIVVGSHGKSGLYKTLIGSISEGIIKEAKCPILVIPTRNL